MNEQIAISGTGALTPEETYGKILIVGRAQTGKTTLAQKLAAVTGLKVLKTSTCRPKRFPDEDTYHFYSVEQAEAIPEDQKLFSTFHVDGFERWTNYQDFLDAGIAVLDPTAMDQAIQLWQSQGFRVTIVYTGDPVDLRQARWVQGFVKSDQSEHNRLMTMFDEHTERMASFEQREKVEAPMFDQLEDMIRNIQAQDDSDAILYPNATPERRTLAGEDKLELYAGRDKIGLDPFVQALSRKLAAGARPAGGSRTIRLKYDLVLEPEHWSEDAWRTICKFLGLVPETTAIAAIGTPVIQYCSNPNTKNHYKTEDNNHAENA